MAYGPGTANPLIDSSGNPLVAVSPGMVTVADACLVAVSGGNEHRHTRRRRAGFVPGRRISVNNPSGNGVELAAVLESYVNTGGGAVGTAFYPPGESGTADDAPRWRHVEAPVFERDGPVKVKWAMELEEVV